MKKKLRENIFLQYKHSDSAADKSEFPHFPFALQSENKIKKHTRREKKRALLFQDDKKNSETVFL